ncbi:CHASE3 domain-containing protein [Azospirillum sp. TSO35-2]|uniref:CHASE3 domain-containing protein n=1 Tax=Azospirillum sp. TSO35-2 TaxID=716796 RepID=UPI000D65DB85|nr:CHASE3 domain-containing protein [Azospirillum sp. TSO35-2]
MSVNTDASLRRRKVRRRAARLSALMFAGLFAGFLLLIAVFLEYRSAIEWVDHTHKVISTVEELQSNLSNAESGQRGYLLTGDSHYLDLYTEGTDGSRVLLDQVGTLTADNPVQQDKVKALRSLTDAKLAVMAATLQQVDAQGLDRARAAVREGTGERLMADIRSVIATMRSEEDGLLARRSRHATLLEALMIAYGLTFAVVTGWLAYTTVRRLEQDYQAERAEGEALATALQQNTLLLDEVNHRVRNSLQIVSNLLRTQALRHRNPEVRDELLVSSSRVSAIAEVHRRLYGEGCAYNTVELADLLKSVAENAMPTTAVAEPAVTMAVDAPLPTPVETAVPVALIVNELLTNSYKHAFPAGGIGSVRLGVGVVGHEIRIDVADDGVGLPQGMESTTEGGFGLNTVRNLTRQLKGHLEIQRLSPGTRFILRFPFEPKLPIQP